jgi:peptide/nickel transport system permease protein
VLAYVLRRLALMVPTVFVISVLAFVIIQLPPGSFAETYAATLDRTGDQVDSALLESLRRRYGLDQPIHVQYLLWMRGILTEWDFGRSFEWNRPVTTLIWERLALTFVISISALVFIWIVAFPVGIYSAVRQYSVGDYLATFLAFIGLAIPNFLLALVFMYIAFAYFGQSVGGLFSPEYANAPWSGAKVLDMLSNLWIPMIVLGTAGTAGLVRIMRANLLDELKKPYVVTARAKGLSERRLLLKYPVRVALNPFVSTVGWVLPQLVSGAAIVAIVLNLPTTGPMLFRALLSQDMYLAGSFILLLSVLTVVGTLISDLLLAWLDPRIRYR